MRNNVVKVCWVFSKTCSITEIQHSLLKAIQTVSHFSVDSTHARCSIYCIVMPMVLQLLQWAKVISFHYLGPACNCGLELDKLFDYLNMLREHACTVLQCMYKYIIYMYMLCYTIYMLVGCPLSLSTCLQVSQTLFTSSN